VKHVKRQLFSSLAIAGNTHDQREYEAMRPFVQRVQSKLIACGNELDERNPVLLGYARLRLVRVEQVTEGSNLGTRWVLVCWFGTHDHRSCRRYPALARGGCSWPHCPPCTMGDYERKVMAV